MLRKIKRGLRWRSKSRSSKELAATLPSTAAAEDCASPEEVFLSEREQIFDVEAYKLLHEAAFEDQVLFVNFYLDLLQELNNDYEQGTNKKGGYNALLAYDRHRRNIEAAIETARSNPLLQLPFFCLLCLCGRSVFAVRLLPDKRVDIYNECLRILRRIQSDVKIANLPDSLCYCVKTELSYEKEATPEALRVSECVRSPGNQKCNLYQREVTETNDEAERPASMENSGDRFPLQPLSCRTFSMDACDMSLNEDRPTHGFSTYSLPILEDLEQHECNPHTSDSEYEYPIGASPFEKLKAGKHRVAFTCPFHRELPDQLELEASLHDEIALALASQGSYEAAIVSVSKAIELKQQIIKSLVPDFDEDAEFAALKLSTLTADFNIDGDPAIRDIVGETRLQKSGNTFSAKRYTSLQAGKFMLPKRSRKRGDKQSKKDVASTGSSPTRTSKGPSFSQFKLLKQGSSSAAVKTRKGWASSFLKTKSTAAACSQVNQPMSSTSIRDLPSYRLSNIDSNSRPFTPISSQAGPSSSPSYGAVSLSSKISGGVGIPSSIPLASSQQQPKHFSGDESKTILSLAYTLMIVGGIYERLSRYVSAEQVVRKALTVRTRYLPTGHTDIAKSLRLLGIIFTRQGKWLTDDGEEVETILKEAAAINRAALGESHLEFGESINDLGIMYFGKNEWAKAESCFRHTIHIQKQFLGEEHPAVSTLYMNLGGACARQNKLQEAEEMLIQAVAIKRRILKHTHDDIASSLLQLGYLYQAQNKFAEAESNFKSALDIFEKVGQDTIDIVWSLNALGQVAMRQMKYKEAEQHILRALEVHRCQQNAYNCNLAGVVASLGDLHFFQDRYELSKQYYEQALAIFLSFNGKEDLDVASMLCSLAGVCSRLGLYTDTLSYGSRAIRIYDSKGQDNASSRFVKDLLLNTQTILKLISRAQSRKATMLMLHNHQLRAWPIEVFKLTWLKSLDLSANNLKQVPCAVTSLVNLTSLNLNSNEIAFLPREIGRLTKLTELRLGHNAIKVFPREILQLPSLQYLAVFSNPILNVEPSGVLLFSLPNSAEPRLYTLDIVPGVNRSAGLSLVWDEIMDTLGGLKPASLRLLCCKALRDAKREILQVPVHLQGLISLEEWRVCDVCEGNYLKEDGEYPFPLLCSPENQTTELVNQISEFDEDPLLHPHHDAVSKGRFWLHLSYALSHRASEPNCMLAGASTLPILYSVCSPRCVNNHLSSLASQIAQPHQILPPPVTFEGILT